MNDQMEYRRRASRYRPSDPKLIANAVMQLRQQGLKPRDIGDALRVPLQNVLEIIKRQTDAQAI